MQDAVARWRTSVLEIGRGGTTDLVRHASALIQLTTEESFLRHAEYWPPACCGEQVVDLILNQRTGARNPSGEVRSYPCGVITMKINPVVSMLPAGIPAD